MSLPKSYKVEESVHKNEVKLEITETNAVEINELPKERKLEIPEINTIEISELPRETRAEMPLEQSKSTLVQNVNLVSDITPFHAKHDILLPRETIDLCKISPLEVSVVSRKVLGKSIPKLHIKQKRVLGSKLVRRANTTRLVKKDFINM